MSNLRFIFVVLLSVGLSSLFLAVNTFGLASSSHAHELDFSDFQEPTSTGYGQQLNMDNITTTWVADVKYDGKVESATHSTVPLPNVTYKCSVGIPPWHALNMREELTAFIPVYEKRPGGSNEGGAGFFHYFALWCAIKSIRPDTIIESGIHNGVGTWFLRQAAGDAKLILISPVAPSVYRDQAKSTKYYTGAEFRDFNSLPWRNILPDTSRAFIFFDDHQAGIRRIQEARAHGFRYIMFDDNYIPGRGDNLSPKKVCNLALYATLGNPPFVYQDNFNKIQRFLSRDEVLTYFQTFEDCVRVYAEFPPVWSGPNRFDVSDAVWADISLPPILEDATEIGFPLTRRKFEAKRYTHITFVELKPHDV